MEAIESGRACRAVQEAALEILDMVGGTDAMSTRRGAWGLSRDGGSPVLMYPALNHHVDDDSTILAI